MYKYGAWHKISKVNYGILFSMNDEQRVYFTRAYTTGTDLWSQLPVASLRNEFIAGLPQNALVLDVGAGRGLWARTLVESGVRVIGIDYVETIVAHVNNELKDRGWESRARFVVADVREIPFIDASFDAVTDIQLFTHIKKEDRLKYKNEITRVLKSGGSFLLTTLSKQTHRYFNWHPRASEVTFFEKDGVSYSFATKDELCEFFGDAFICVADTIEEIGAPDPVCYHSFLFLKK
jgi:cyclopropane fatty-acyl-phospholipid synthase-like methyltransferase